MALILNANEMAVAKESYRFWRDEAKADHIHAIGAMANEMGETGFIWKRDADGKLYTPPGDNGNACGPFQMWPARGNLVLEKTGLDPRHGTHIEALRACFAEMTQPWSSYRNFWPAYVKTTTLWSAVAYFDKEYERSKNQAADTIKRAAMALFLDHQFKDAEA